MSAPDGPRPRWPLRTIGFVLLQLAAVATVVGLVTVATGDGSDSAGRGSVDAGAPASSASPAPAPSSSPSPPSSSSRPAPDRDGPLAIPTAGPTRAPAAPAPSTRAPAARPPAAPGANGPRDVRVLNNSKIHGLAARAANDFNAAGWRVVEVGNYAAGIIPTSTVYYDEGQRASADAIAGEFGMRVQPRFPGLAGGAPGLVVIVTQDYGSGAAERQAK